MERCSALGRKTPAGGRRYEKRGLAFGERGGGDDAGAFFHRDDLVGGDIFELSFWPLGQRISIDVGFSVIA